MKKPFLIIFLLLVSIFSCQSVIFSEGDYFISFVFQEFHPENPQIHVPFEVIFKLKNTGSEFISPFAEVTISGKILDSEDNAILRLREEQYRVHNFVPGAQTGRLRYYIGTLEEGAYKVELVINSYNKVKKRHLSRDTFDWLLPQ